MKIKALKHFYSPVLNAVGGETYDIELDQYTFDNWKEGGLIEEVKTKRTKKVDSTDEVVIPDESQ